MNLHLTLALRYLGGRKLRTALTTMAVMFGVLVIFGMNSMLPAIVQAFQANTMAAANEVDATVISKTGETFSSDVVGRVGAIDGVRVVSGSLERSISLPVDYFDRDPGLPDRVNALTVIGIEPDAARSISVFILTDGRFLEASDRRAAVITESLAEVAGVQVGDAIELPTPTGLAELTVVGLLPQRLMPGNEEVLMPLVEAQALFNLPDQINVVRANFDVVDTATRHQIEQNIQTRLGSGFSLGVLHQNEEILSNIRIAQVVFSLIGGLGLLMGAFIIFNTFRTVVAERRRDIGMLRSLGAERGTIAWMILTEGLVQGVVGTAAGLVLGYLIAQGALLAVTPILRQFINLQTPSVAIQPGLVILSIAAGVGITLLAVLLPATAASRVSPLEALRPEVGAMTLKRATGRGFWLGVALIVLAILALFSDSLELVGLGSLLFIGGLLLVSPALVDPIARLFSALIALVFARDGTAALAQSNLARQPGRAAITASTIMISLAILVLAAGLLSSIQLTFTNMLRESLRSDFLLLPPTVTTWSMNSGAAPELSEQLQSVEGVDVVSTLRFAPTQINGVPIGLLGIDPDAYQRTSGLTFVEGDPDTAFQEMEDGRGIIVNGLLAAQAGLGIGDRVSALTVDGEVTYTVVGIANDFLNAKTNTGYISQASIASDFGSTEDVFFQINLTENADRAAVEAAFRNLIRAYPQFKLIEGQAYREQNLKLFKSMFAGMGVLVLFLAIPSLIAMVNTLAIGVIERRREIGILRAVGADRRQVSSIILIEAVILAAIGTAFGMLSGLYLGYSVISAVNAAGLSVDYVFPGVGIVLGIAAGLLFGVAAAVIPARQAAGLQVVSALRYE